MASDQQRIVTLEGQVRKLMATVSALQGQPADATLSIPHNDSFPFEDNVDATHPANLRYVISKNVTRVVSARLSIFMAAYRTYNSLSLTSTGNDNTNHTHQLSLSGNLINVTLGIDAGNSFTGQSGGVGVGGQSPSSNGRSAFHQHPVSGSAVLGVTEGTVATGVTLSFDGVDHTADLGGPFNADVIELDVRRFIGTAIGVKHTIAMQPSGLGRIEAFLRLGVYVSAAQVL